MVRQGPPVSDWRSTIDACLWIASSGKSWRDLPARFGKWNTVYRRFATWSREGRWRLLADVCADPTRGWHLWGFSEWLRKNASSDLRADLVAVFTVLERLAERPELNKRKGGRRPYRPALMPELIGCELTDARWDFIKVAIDYRYFHVSRGRPTDRPRQYVEGALWLVRHGASWKELPPEFGPSNSARRLFQVWTERDTWQGLKHIIRGSDEGPFLASEWRYHGVDVADAQSDAQLHIIIDALCSLKASKLPKGKC